jgi:hypothetical protein
VNKDLQKVSCGTIIGGHSNYRNRWEDDVKSDITKMKIANWRDCIKNRPKWKKIP